MITKILIYFFTKTEPIEIVTIPEKKIVNACERGSLYTVLFSNDESYAFPIQHIYRIKMFREKIKQPDYAFTYSSSCYYCQTFGRLCGESHRS